MTLMLMDHLWATLLPAQEWLTCAGRLAYPIFAYLIALEMGGIQIFSLAAVPVLAMYNGKRGKYQWKPFFYLYYPIHLAVLYGIAQLM